MARGRMLGLRRLIAGCLRSWRRSNWDRLFPEWQRCRIGKRWINDAFGVLVAPPILRLLFVKIRQWYQKRTRRYAIRLRHLRSSLRAYARWLRYLCSLFPSASGCLTDGLRATRKPRSLLRPDGKPLPRCADRQKPASRPQHPPRSTRLEPPLGPCGSVDASGG